MKKLKTLTIHSNLTLIRNSAFYRCHVPEIHFQDVDTIMESAFYDCLSTNITFLSSPNNIGTEAFWNCSIRELNFNRSTSIANKAFYNATNLRIAIFGEGCNLESFGEQTFELCSSLEFVRIPSGIKKISKSVFSQCTKLTNIEFGQEISALAFENKCFAYCGFTKFVITSFMQSFDSLAFMNCNNLIEIIIEGFPIEIKTGVFSECNQLNKITIQSEEIKFETLQILLGSNINQIKFINISINTNPNSINDIRFSEFKNVKHIKIMNSNIMLNSCLFANCENLKSIFMYTNIINESLFENCTKLTKIVIPSVLKSSKSRALIEVYRRGFYNCRSLDFHILDYVSVVGDSAFYGCSFPQKIVIPNTIERISDRSFINSGIKMVYFCSNYLICTNNSFDKTTVAFVTDSYQNRSFCNLSTTKIDSSSCQVIYPTNSIYANQLYKFNNRRR